MSDFEEIDPPSVEDRLTRLERAMHQRLFERWSLGSDIQAVLFNLGAIIVGAALVSVVVRWTLGVWGVL